VAQAGEEIAGIAGIGKAKAYRGLTRMSADRDIGKEREFHRGGAETRRKSVIGRKKKFYH
jgi:hypothetical protein